MSVEIRPIRRTDVPAVVAMVHELADYERAPRECHLTDAQLEAALFAESPALFGHIALLDGEAVGMALWFLNFSTWRGVHGVYLEDLYVRPSARGKGVGRALLATLAAVCTDRGYERLEWWVLHWNPAREFYHSIDAVAMDEWVPYRLAGPALHALAATAPVTGAGDLEPSLRGDAG
ncbi:GNAT family N-acetyltransferase [Planosporangium thailandense]|uniref:GNAT family N-acetyltransferase n=1 Tax=Planosporangium thailandense TaxID=765197 RepID=A0ABX0Y0C5_9ACTN|nr:GNAT family N-acetyltransferase [Planosporangium thailandense]NJC70917.1 GNAT family N-acetyltransferase [Planosporangium thailandense]